MCAAPFSSHFSQLTNNMLEDVSIVMDDIASDQSLHEEDMVVEEGIKVLEQLAYDGRFSSLYVN